MTCDRPMARVLRLPANSRETAESLLLFPVLTLCGHILRSLSYILNARLPHREVVLGGMRAAKYPFP